MGGSAVGRTMGGGEWGLLILLSILWGGSFFFNAVALTGLPILGVVVGRVVLAALALHAVLRLMGQRLPREPRVVMAFLGMGLLNNAIPFSLIVWGQAHIASGLAAILNATTPLFTVLIAHAATGDERLTPLRLAGVVVGLGGIAAMVGAEAAGALGQHLWAELACLAAAISYAVASVFGRRFRTMGVAPLATAAGQLTASSALMLPVWLIVDRPWTLQAPGTAALAALVGLALASTALAYVVYFRLLARAGASNLMLVTFLIPISAGLLGVAFLGETVGPREAAGMAAVAFGLALIDGRLFRRRARLQS